jgi:hypothetical protein
MAELQIVRTVVAEAGFVVEDFVESSGLPAPMTVWKPFILIGATPTVHVPDDSDDWDDRVDRAWLRLSTRNGTIGPDGTVLLAVEGAGKLPWLRARVGEVAPRASAIGLRGEDIGFVALAPDGKASTAVSSEEYETWIFADPAPPEE